jgi:hypothetical protein
LLFCFGLLLPCFLKKIFGPKRDEVTERRKLHNEELNILHSSPNVIRQIKIKENEVGGTCGTHGREEEYVQGFDGKTRRKETTWNTKA